MFKSTLAGGLMTTLAGGLIGAVLGAVLGRASLAPDAFLPGWEVFYYAIVGLVIGIVAGWGCWGIAVIGRAIRDRRQQRGSRDSV